MSTRSKDAGSPRKKQKTRSSQFLVSGQEQQPTIDLCYSDSDSDTHIPFNNIQRKSKNKNVKVEEEEGTPSEHLFKRNRTEDSKDGTVDSSVPVTPRRKPRYCGLCNQTLDECHMNLFGTHCFNSCKKAIARNGALNMTVQEIHDIFFRSYLDAAEFHSQSAFNECVDYSHLHDVNLPSRMAEITYEDTMVYFGRQVQRVIKKKVVRQKDNSESFDREQE